MSAQLDFGKLKSRIDKLEKQELIEIFKIVHSNEIKYTQNINGVFLDLNILNKQTLIQIQSFIEFIDENKKHIHMLEDKMRENKNTIDNPKSKFTRPYELKQVVICQDYSPFVTELEDNNNFHVDIEDTCLETKDISNLDEDEDNFSLDEDIDDVQSISQSIQKKKKNNGLITKIMKKCKNINLINTDSDDLDINTEDFDCKELSIELEWI